MISGNSRQGEPANGNSYWLEVSSCLGLPQARGKEAVTADIFFMIFSLFSYINRSIPERVPRENKKKKSSKNIHLLTSGFQGYSSRKR
jgi:hypothetical protein